MSADPFPPTLDHLLGRADLTEAQAQWLMDRVLAGALGKERLAALITALRAKGVAVPELIGFARAMRTHSHKISSPKKVILDNCGTGGAPCKTVNISTAAAFVMAGAGYTVAKHGNRSVTRPSGSADVLEKGGAILKLSPEECQEILNDQGICFLFAPTFHPAMRHAGPVRQALGVKTVFNLLGPLTNPAGATHQVLGVYEKQLVEPMAQALAALGCVGGFVLHGEPGFDEASPCGPVWFSRIQDGVAGPLEAVDPTTLGVEATNPEALASVPAKQALVLFQDMLSGTAPQPFLDTLALNVAFALVAVGGAKDLRAGVKKAQKLIAKGVGRTKWEAFVQATQSL